MLPQLARLAARSAKLQTNGSKIQLSRLVSSSRKRPRAEDLTLEHQNRLQTQLHESLKAHETYGSSEEKISSLIQIRDVCEELHDWAKALKVHQELLETKDTTCDDWRRLGILQRRTEQVGAARLSYEKALELASTLEDKALVEISQAGMYFQLGDWEKALALLKVASPQEDETKIECFRDQGLVLRTMDRNQEALESYANAVQLATDSETRIGLRMDMADMHAALKQTEEALELYNAIVDECPHDPALQSILHHKIGRLHAQEGRMEDAATSLYSSLELKLEWFGDSQEETGKTLAALGAVEEARGNKAEALQHFHKALLVARANADDQENDENVLLALHNIAVLKGDKEAKFEVES